MDVVGVVLDDDRGIQSLKNLLISDIMFQKALKTVIRQPDPALRYQSPNAFERFAHSAASTLRRAGRRESAGFRKAPV